MLSKYQSVLFNSIRTPSFNTSHPAADLTEAQRQAFSTLPVQLQRLVDLEIVSAQWALELPDTRRLILTQGICELLVNYIIKPADIAKNFDTSLIIFLGEHESV